MAIQASSTLIDALKRYQAGDMAAFDIIYYESNAYITKCVLNVLQKTVGEVSEDLQQDILQDTYLTIANKLPELQESAAFLQWAGRIATHIAERTWQKDARVHAMETADEEMTLELMDENFIPEDILLNREKQQLIRRTLEELPTNQYLCVIEYFYNGLKEREIAQKLDMPVNTVKTNLSRAKKNLRGAIETKQEKSGIKLYNMAWLLLLLLRRDLFTFTVSPKQEQAVLAAIHTELGIGSAAASVTVGAAGGASASASASGSASATATAVGTKAAGTAVATKVAAAAIAGTLAVGAAIGIPLATRDREPEPTENTWQIPEDAFRYNGHSYYLYREPQDSWEAAKAFCEELGGHLVVITTQQENDAVHGYLTTSGYENAYIGLFQETDGQWYWVNGETAEYLNWAPGEPSNDHGGETYAMFYYKFQNGTWNDGNYGQGTRQDDLFFLCEWEG